MAEESATEIACIAFAEWLAARSGVLANGATQRQAAGRGSSSKTSSLQAVRASEKLRAARRLSARDPAKSKHSSISTRAFGDISVSWVNVGSCSDCREIHVPAASIGKS